MSHKESTVLRELLEKWLLSISERPSIVALNIGLFESDAGYTAYLVGASEYDPEDDDWACSEDFIPQNRYCQLNIPSENDWRVVHRQVVEAITDSLGQESKPEILSIAPVVTVGFDDGELEQVK